MSARKISNPSSRGPASGPTAKAVRFSVVVQECGRPEIIYLWTEPEANDDFMKAVREGRVMTLTQSHTGTHQDVGLVHFFEGDNAAYLVFPKSLAPFHQRRVIGINYDLIKIPGPVGPAMNPSAGSRRDLEKPAKKYRIKFRFTAIAETVAEVEADSKKAAIEKASHTVQPPDFSRARVSRKMIKADSEER